MAIMPVQYLVDFSHENSTDSHKNDQVKIAG